MAELRFVGAPRKKEPNKALLAAGLVILLAAAFGVGRLWTRPPAPITVPAAAATARAPGPTSAPPTVAATAPPKTTPTAAFQPTPPGIKGSEAFVITRTPAPAAPASAAVEPSAAPETLSKQIARCLSFTVARDNMFTVTSGVRLLVRARNRCSQTFPGSEARFEVRAMAVNGAGFAGRERGSFQVSIQPYETVETVITVSCDPDRAYRFEVEVM
jgi:hypothetical protein